MCRRKLETLALPVSERVLYGNQTRLTPALLRGPGQRSHEQTLSQPLSSGLGRNGQIMQMQGVRGGDGAASIIKWWRQAPARGLRKQIGLHAAGRGGYPGTLRVGAQLACESLQIFVQMGRINLALQRHDGAEILILHGAQHRPGGN